MSSALLRSTLALSLSDPPTAQVDDIVRPHRADGRTRAAVIGSGFGGLAAAIRLQAAGVQTTIFEARDKPGGCAYVYEQDGFTFDQGPTVITAPHCLEELFTLAGKRMDDYVQLLPVHPMYRLSWEDGSVINYDVSEGQMEREIARLVSRRSRRLSQVRRLRTHGCTRLATASWPPNRSCAFRTWCARPRRWCACAPTARCIRPCRVSCATNACARPCPSTPCSSAAIPSRPAPSTR
jgi:2-polyprenyl-6-methoxyphenol hydroxylase-like FAD-dependent oxidoreductase